MRPYSHRTSTNQARQSRSFADRRRRRLIWVGALLVISLGTWLYSASAFTRLGAFAVSDVTVTGADADIAPSIRSAAMAALQGSYLHLFSRANDLIYPQAQIAAAAQAASPRVSSVSVSRDGFNGLRVTVAEKAPSALVCASLPDFDADGSLSFSDSDPCYYADSSGIVYEAAASSSASAYNRYFIPDLGDDGSPVLGSPATSTAEWQALQDLYNGARDAGVAPVGVLMKDGGEYELYTASSSDIGTIVVYFDDTGGFGQELSDLASFWKAMVGPASTDPDTSPFEYIDVRYAPNVFYRQSK